jgi:hypothetical protein
VLLVKVVVDMANKFGSPADKRLRYTSPSASPARERLNLSPYCSPVKHGLQRRKHDGTGKTWTPPRVLVAALMAAGAFTLLNLSLRFFLYEPRESTTRKRSKDSINIHYAFDEGINPRPGDMPNWMSGHTKLAQELADACSEHRHAYDFLWYGDSITESFREQVRGEPCLLRCSGISKVWENHYGEGSGYTAAALGLSGQSSLLSLLITSSYFY